jgi:hypothetical protein
MHSTHAAPRPGGGAPPVFVFLKKMETDARHASAYLSLFFGEDPLADVDPDSASRLLRFHGSASFLGHAFTLTSYNSPISPLFFRLEKR